MAESRAEDDPGGGTAGQPGRPASGPSVPGEVPSNAHHPLGEAIGEPVHQSRDFPSGGGSGQGTGAPGVALGGAGSTGRNASDEGKTDASGATGGGMAGSAGG